MQTTSQVARFIAARIEATGQLQKDIAVKCGFEKPNIITMIKQGTTRLPLDKIGPMAIALGVDPVQLFKMCMEEYHPATWKAIAPLIGSAISPDELILLTALRRSSGGPLMSELSGESKLRFENFIASLCSTATSQ